MFFGHFSSFFILSLIICGIYGKKYNDNRSLHKKYKIPKPSIFSGLNKNWKAQQNSTNFLVIADWGGLPIFPFTTDIEVNVAKQMSMLANTLSPEFVLAIGDNFYYDGVKSVDDLRFQETYEKVYSSSSLQIPWYMVAGNHDWKGNVSAQIAYSKVSKRWNFPDYNYWLNFTFNDGQTTVAVIMIDTVVMCGEDCDYKIPRRPKNIVCANNTWVWIETQLKKFSAQSVDYLLIAGHYPVFSVAEHGSCPCLQPMLALMKKYNVTAYLNGHEHNLQHLQVDEQNFFVVGAGNFVSKSTRHIHSVPAGALLFHWAEPKKLGAFGVITVGEKEMTMSFVNGVGESIYKYSMNPRWLPPLNNKNDDIQL